jgi:hypothetical protein
MWKFQGRGTKKWMSSIGGVGLKMQWPNNDKLSITVQGTWQRRQTSNKKQQGTTTHDLNELRCCMLTLDPSIRTALVRYTRKWYEVNLPTASETDRKSVSDSSCATRFILSLAFRCESSETSYKNQILKANLLPLSYWHEYLDFISVPF